MAVEFVAPPGHAQIEEKLAIRLNLHMIAISAILGNTVYVCQAYLKKRFVFTDGENVRIGHGTDNCDILVKTEDGRRIKYQYHYRRSSISHCSMYDAEGNVIDADLETVQASYETVSNYCAAIIAGRMEAAQEVAPEPDSTATEAN